MFVKKIFYSYIGIAIVSASFTYFLLQLNQSSSQNTTQFFRIAFATKAAPYHDNAMKGFIKKLKSKDDSKYQVKVYISEGQNQQLATSIMEEIVTSKPDLICTVGATLSQVARSVTQKRKSNIPVLFMGATDPVKLGLVKNLESSGTNMTGINMTELGEDKAVQVLRLLKPSAQHVLLPYCPLSSGGDVEIQALHAKNVLEQHGTRVTLIPIYKLPEILPRVKSLIENADTVMYLPGCLVDEVADGLIKLCNQYHVSLFANQPTTVQQGAAFGYGTDARILGEKAFLIATKILDQNIAPTDIPVQFMDFGRRTAVNLDAAKRQGLKIDENLLFFFSRGVIYKNGLEL